MRGTSRLFRGKKVKSSYRGVFSLLRGRKIFLKEFLLDLFEGYKFGIFSGHHKNTILYKFDFFFFT